MKRYVTIVTKGSKTCSIFPAKSNNYCRFINEVRSFGSEKIFLNNLKIYFLKENFFR